MSYNRPAGEARTPLVTSSFVSSSVGGDSYEKEDEILQGIGNILHHTGVIKKQTSALITSYSSEPMRQKVSEAMGSATATIENAKSLLDCLIIPSGVSLQEQSTRKMTQQRLRENLERAKRDLESARQAFDQAAATRDAQPQTWSGPARITPTSEPPQGQQSAPLAQRQLRIEQVPEHLVQSHAEHVDLYVQDINRVRQDMSGLHRSMSILAQHAQEQGYTLDTIEANMGQTADNAQAAVEQIVQTNTTHQKRTSCLCVLLILCFLVALALVVTLLKKAGFF